MAGKILGIRAWAAGAGEGPAAHCVSTQRVSTQRVSTQRVSTQISV